jgi:dienelactone hydrolase
VRSERVDYVLWGTTMVGYLATDGGTAGGPRPGVLLMHEGGGQDDNVRARADRLASLGYCAFALDYFGGGTQHPLPVAQARLGELYEDHRLTQEAAMAGYEILAGQPGVDPHQIAAVGFCFGGAMALELARCNVPLRAAVGFHPGFVRSRLDGTSTIDASVLLLCGADDPVVPAEDRALFEADMRACGVTDWRLEVYGGVGHSFTNPDIAARGLGDGFAFDERADRRSWRSMLALFDEVFATR